MIFKKVLNLILIIPFILFITSCSQKKEIIIGFAANLSGKDSELGVSGRNAAEFWVKNQNDNGGINGKKIRLVIKDFKNDVNLVIPTDYELLNEGAIVILGHYTSLSATTALPFLDKEKITLISPTASSSSLSGFRDFFFRTIMDSSKDSLYLANHMIKNNYTKLLIINTELNSPYTSMYIDYLKNHINVVSQIGFSDPNKIDFNIIPLKKDFDAILIIASAIDTGLIAQSLRIKGFRQPLYVSGWAGNNSLIEYGGKATEGAVFVHQINEEAENLVDFTRKYKQTYAELPDFAAIETWDSLSLIKTVLELGGAMDKDQFYQTLQNIVSFHSFGEKIIINEYGDVTRPVYIKKVQNGKMTILDKFE